MACKRFVGSIPIASTYFACSFRPHSGGASQRRIAEHSLDELLRPRRDRARGRTGDPVRLVHEGEGLAHLIAQWWKPLGCAGSGARVPEVTEHAHATLFEIGCARILVLVDHVLVERFTCAASGRGVASY